jgi:dTDP-4-dehydrorhamnose 3,5-epimerase
MKFEQVPLAGACLVSLDRLVDDRGFFARAFCAREFAAAGLENNFVQANNTLTMRAGTLRGFHYQLPPSAEVKLVRCSRGAIYDIIVDLRPDSKTFKQSFGAQLDQENRQMMYVPRGFAHGFITLSDDSEVNYMVSNFYDAKQERGLRYNDPALTVAWPAKMREISAKDNAWPNFDPVFHGVEAFRNLSAV